MRSRLVRLALVAAVASALLAATGTATAMTLSTHNASVVLDMVDGLLAEELLALQAAMEEEENWNELKFRPIALDALEGTRLRLEQLGATLQRVVDGEKVPAGRAHGQAESAFAIYPAHLLTPIQALEAIALAGDRVEEAFEEIESALDPAPTAEDCFNNLDDDGDGLVDFDDPDCLREA